MGFRLAPLTLTLDDLEPTQFKVITITVKYFDNGVWNATTLGRYTFHRTHFLLNKLLNFIESFFLEQEIRSVERVSTQCCCTPCTLIEIFDCNCNDLELGRFKIIQGQRSRCQSIAYGWFPIRLPLTPSSYLSPFSKYLTCNFNDLELAGFKVIQGQR